jgi:predicted nucleotidyltransferase
MNKNAFGLSDRDMKTIATIFQRYPEAQIVFIFGSRAKGTYKLGSDIDLAIMNEGVNDTLVSKLKSDFEDSSLPYRVDLVNFHATDRSDLKDHIQRVGKLFYESFFSVD